ncbi:MAG: hypothetical protein ACERKZ_15615 [Lachnotalea sp.]
MILKTNEECSILWENDYGTNGGTIQVGDLDSARNTASLNGTRGSASRYFVLIIYDEIIIFFLPIYYHKIENFSSLVVLYAKE